MALCLMSLACRERASPLLRPLQQGWLCALKEPLERCQSLPLLPPPAGLWSARAPPHPSGSGLGTGRTSAAGGAASPGSPSPQPPSHRCRPAAAAPRPGRGGPSACGTLPSAGNGPSKRVLAGGDWVLPAVPRGPGRSARTIHNTWAGQNPLRNHNTEKVSLKSTGALAGLAQGVEPAD